jgi:hypothetical protein
MQVRGIGLPAEFSWRVVQAVIGVADMSESIYIVPSQTVLFGDVMGQLDYLDDLRFSQTVEGQSKAIRHGLTIL